jgi:hypothetical protein
MILVRSQHTAAVQYPRYGGIVCKISALLTVHLLSQWLVGYGASDPCTEPGRPLQWLWKEKNPLSSTKLQIPYCILETSKFITVQLQISFHLAYDKPFFSPLWSYQQQKKNNTCQTTHYRTYDFCCLCFFSLVLFVVYFDFFFVFLWFLFFSKFLLLFVLTFFVYHWFYLFNVAYGFWAFFCFLLVFIVSKLFLLFVLFFSLVFFCKVALVECVCASWFVCVFRCLCVCVSVRGCVFSGVCVCVWVGVCVCLRVCVYVGVSLCVSGRLCVCFCGPFLV